MKINKNYRRKSGFTLVELLVVIAIIATLAALSTPAITSALQRAAVTTSVSNARQIRLALENYAIDFDGNYVNDANGLQVMPTGSTATAEGCYSVLLNSGSLAKTDEELFYTKELSKAGVAVAPQVDNNGTLTTAECGYSYVKGLFNTSAGSAPIVTTRLAAAGGPALTGTFYTEVWEHKAVIARVNNSVRAERLNGVATPGTPAAVLEVGAGGSASAADVFGFAVGGDVL